MLQGEKRPHPRPIVEIAPSTPKIHRIPAEKPPKRTQDVVLKFPLTHNSPFFYIQPTPKRVLINCAAADAAATSPLQKFSHLSDRTVWRSILHAGPAIKKPKIDCLPFLC